ncbi:hypothetical protein EV121DRAFT_274558 [Schizophyllum commune]
MSDNGSDDSLNVLFPSEARDALAVLTDHSVNNLAYRFTGLELNDDETTSLAIDDLEKVLSKTSLRLESDGGYYLFYQDERVNHSVVITPRSNWAFNNGPDGSAVLKGYNSSTAKLPFGLSFDPIPSDKYVSYKKTSVINDKVWETQVFESAFKNGSLRAANWAISGQPCGPAQKIATDIFHAFKNRLSDETVLKVTGATTLNKNCPHDPEKSMWWVSHRPVFVPNNVPLDEGYASEYLDPFGILRDAGRGPDLKYNRVPEVLVRCAGDSGPEWARMSFHDIHMIDRAIFQVVCTPRLYVRAKSEEAFWEYRIVCIRVLGRRTPAVLQSPVKAVKKRKAPMFDTAEQTEDEEDAPPAKK